MRPELEPEECRHAVWFRGHKIPRDPGYPERAWGAYLPGDEPHWQCGHKEKRGDPCPLEWSLECPLIQETERLCPFCLADEEQSRVWTAREHLDEPVCCPVCNTLWACFTDYLEDAACAAEGDEE